MTRANETPDPMPTSPETLPRYNAPKAKQYERSGRVLTWAVYLTLGFFARLSLLAVWIFTDLVDDAFGTWIVPALGFALVPWTTLTFALVWPIGSDKVSGWDWIAVGTALFVDYLFWALSRSAFK